MGGHGAADALNAGAGRESLSPGGVKAVVEAGDGNQGASEHEKQEDGPSVDPDLGESGSEAEVGCDVGCLVYRRSWYVRGGVVVSHLMAASGERWR